MQRLLWYLFVLTLPFGVRLLLSGPAQFSEYESIFLYASDIALTLFVLYSIPGLIADARASGSYQMRISWKVPALLFILCSVVSLTISSSVALSLVAALRLMLMVIALFAVRRLLCARDVFITTLIIVSLLALFQAVVAITQFTGQGPLGLKVLGESPISIADPGTAKISVEGLKLIRAYGTMPDPNILAGFLLVGLAALTYLFIKADKGLYVDAWDNARSISANFQSYITSRLLYVRITASAAIFIISMGLVFTFSRSGWASAALMMALMLIMAARNSVRSAGRFLALLIIITGSLYYFFSPLIMARAGLSADEPSVSYRVEYTKIGLESISAHPLLGVGIGNQVRTSIGEGRYAEHKMTRSWEYQPVHNLYLLIASEIGILGALAFCIFLVIVMKRLVLDKSMEAGLALALLGGLLFFGLFDHFLWDIQAGRLMFWFTVALALAERETPSSFNG